MTNQTSTLAPDFTISGKDFRWLTDRVLFNAAVSSPLSSLATVEIVLGNGKLQMTAADGHRLATVQLPVETDTVRTIYVYAPELKKFSTPVNTLPVQVAFEGNTWVLTCGKRSAKFYPTTDQYPNWQAVIPCEWDSVASISKKDLGVLLGGLTDKIRFSKGKLFSKVGDVVETRDLPAGWEDVPRMEFNPTYLRDLTRVPGEGVLYLTFKKNTASVVVEETGDRRAFYMIMPIWC